MHFTVFPALLLSLRPLAIIDDLEFSPAKVSDCLQTDANILQIIANWFLKSANHTNSLHKFDFLSKNDQIYRREKNEKSDSVVQSLCANVHYWLCNIIIQYIPRRGIHNLYLVRRCIYTIYNNNYSFVRTAAPPD